MPTTIVSVRLSPALLSKLDGLCQSSAQRRTDVLRWLITSAGMDDLPQTWPSLGAQGGHGLVDTQ
jgi:hypothetical protein